MNAFEKYGMTHLSPSSTALFARQPALWVVEKLMGKRAPVGCAAHRGSAAEHGVAMGLLDPSVSVDKCMEAALAHYDKITALSGDVRRVKEREAIPGLVRTALAELRLYGVPKCQGKITHKFEDVSVPVIGFYDFLFEDPGVVVDLKTQLRLSSEISTDHARQLGFYVHNSNLEGRICYTTPSRIGVYRLENPAAHVAALRNICRRIERFLSVSSDPNELAAIVCPDVDSYYYSEPTARAICREVFGL